MKPFIVALVTLALIHSAVSFYAYRRLTKTSVVYSAGGPVETTTPEERASDRASFTMTEPEALAVKITRPNAVICYMWSGYIGLVAALLYVLYFGIRYGL